ncbi:hypothetical protein [Nocardia sp. NBC_01009]|uniref:hypothetical protein n=1 Tax=Nocardia sp. NBC_01009 TaxID=2975996 RepID=UPI00386CF194|nr:hypothetical protein OHA42_26470 [Nocardia sp. NBC_01009]
MRSLTISAESAKDAGWFDPILLGASPFHDTQGPRRKPWDLTVVTQRWLRDLLWEHLSDEALKPTGKRPCDATIVNRIAGITLLSQTLEQNRTDHGMHPERIGKADAEMLRQTWALWFREQTRCPSVVQTTNHACSPR